MPWEMETVIKTYHRDGTEFKIGVGELEFDGVRREPDRFYAKVRFNDLQSITGGLKRKAGAIADAKRFAKFFDKYVATFIE